MAHLLKVGPEKDYVDLVVSFESAKGEEMSGPPVRYYIK